MCQRAIVAIIDGTVRGLAAQRVLGAILRIGLYEGSSDAMKSRGGRLRAADGKARRRRSEMLIRVGVSQRSRLLKRVMIGVEVSLK